MELYKFINENKIEKYSKGFVVLDHMIYTNPKEEHIRAAGYKDLVVEEQPEYDAETQYLAFKYVDGDVITKKWAVEEFEKEEIL
jgi:hypothetical protein